MLTPEAHFDALFAGLPAMRAVFSNGSGVAR
jgi:hypothetical protein